MVMSLLNDNWNDMTDNDHSIHFADWIEKYSKKYDRNFWKNTATGEKLWHPPHSKTKDDRMHAVSTEGIASRADLRVNGQIPCFNSSSKTDIGTAVRSPYISNENEIILEDNDTTRAKLACSPSRKHEKVNHVDEKTFDLPGWEQFRSKKHDKFYWRNRMTNETTWKRPVPKSLVDYAPILGQRYLNNRETSKLSPEIRRRKFRPDSRSDSQSPTSSSICQNASYQQRITSAVNSKIEYIAEDMLLVTDISQSERAQSQSIDINFINNSLNSSDNQFDKINAVHTDKLNNVSSKHEHQDEDMIHTGTDYTNNTNESVTDRWVLKHSRKNGRKYWKDRITGKTTWNLPTSHPVAHTAAQLAAAVVALNMSSSYDDGVSTCASTNKAPFVGTKSGIKSNVQLPVQPPVVHTSQLDASLTESMMLTSPPPPPLLLPTHVIPQYVTPVLQVLTEDLPLSTFKSATSDSNNLEGNGSRSSDITSANDMTEVAPVRTVPTCTIPSNASKDFLTQFNSLAITDIYLTSPPPSNINSHSTMISCSPSLNRPRPKALLPTPNNLDFKTINTNQENIRLGSYCSANNDEKLIKIKSKENVKKERMFDLDGNVPWKFSSECSSHTNPLQRFLMENRIKISHEKIKTKEIR